MTPFLLRVISPDGIEFEGQVEELTVRTTSGDMGILAGHIPCVAPLGMGCSCVVIDGKKRYAACIGGMVAVMADRVELMPTTFEWADEIDLKRVELSYERAQRILETKHSSNTDIALAEARLKRALVRRSVASMK